MNQKIQRKFAMCVKIRLLEENLSLAALGRKLSPARPRNSISLAIHTKKLPGVRRQIQEALKLVKP